MADKKAIPEGQRYSQVYLKGKVEDDSKRFRNRLCAIYERNRSERFSNEVATKIAETLGREVPYTSGIRYVGVCEFLKGATLEDFLDSITIITSVTYPRDKSAWIFAVREIIKEEMISYRIDDKGGVHPLIDAEFENNRVLALTCLNDPRYNAVAKAFEDCHNHLDKDTKIAVRSIFEAVEIIYTLITSERRLDSSGAKKRILPLLDAMYTDDKTALDTSRILLNGFLHWVNSLQAYRHGQPTKEPIAPPDGLAIEIISLGATYLRWLVAIDKSVQTP